MGKIEAAIFVWSEKHELFFNLVSVYAVDESLKLQKKKKTLQV